jgi:hypothetical protein
MFRAAFLPFFNRHSSGGFFEISRKMSTTVFGDVSLLLFSQMTPELYKQVLSNELFRSVALPVPRKVSVVAKSSCHRRCGR